MVEVRVSGQFEVTVDGEPFALFDASKLYTVEREENGEGAWYVLRHADGDVMARWSAADVERAANATGGDADA